MQPTPPFHWLTQAVSCKWDRCAIFLFRVASFSLHLPREALGKWEAWAMGRNIFFLARGDSPLANTSSIIIAKASTSTVFLVNTRPPPPRGSSWHRAAGVADGRQRTEPQPEGCQGALTVPMCTDGACFCIKRLHVQNVWFPRSELIDEIHRLAKSLNQLFFILFSNVR